MTILRLCYEKKLYDVRNNSTGCKYSLFLKKKLLIKLKIIKIYSFRKLYAFIIV